MKKEKMGDARLELAKQLMHWALNPTPLASRVTSHIKKIKLLK